MLLDGRDERLNGGLVQPTLLHLAAAGETELRTVSCLLEDLQVVSLHEAAPLYSPRPVSSGCTRRPRAASSVF
jgi:hypothetical protein